MIGASAHLNCHCKLGGRPGAELEEGGGQRNVRATQEQPRRETNQDGLRDSVAGHEVGEKFA